jgi:predicted DNA-binding antitoxin AbrB/MazE fold protein
MEAMPPFRRAAMTTPTTVLAVYRDGVLRLAEPLPLTEGETVEVTISRPAPAEPPLTEGEAIRRMKAAKTLQELFAIYESLPPPADGYDLIEALEENRRLSGERPLYPPEGPEGSE